MTKTTLTKTTLTKTALTKTALTNSNSKGITFYRAADAPSLDDDGIMTPPELDESVRTLDLTPLAAGSKVTVLFKGDGPDGMSLVHAWFGPGYRLPRHTHSADCLYFVVAGEAVMGNKVVKAGDGFFVKADKPYAYSAGPEGIQILEFRAKTAFDMKVLDQTVARWKPIVDIARANHDRWLEVQPA
jgi:quercetin dioxygenase-like cupin family protein